MRADQVRHGETYVLHIPVRDRTYHFRPPEGSTDHPGLLGLRLLGLELHRPTDFAITVTDPDTQLVDTRTGALVAGVTGTVLQHTSSTEILLPAEAVAQLGLDSAQAHTIRGVIFDAAGAIVTLPIDTQVIVPVRWLRVPGGGPAR